MTKIVITISLDLPDSVEPIINVQSDVVPDKVDAVKPPADNHTNPDVTPDNVQSDLVEPETWEKDVPQQFKQAVNKLNPRPCEHCGNFFQPSVPNQKFDNKQCKDKEYRRQKRIKAGLEIDKPVESPQDEPAKDESKHALSNASKKIIVVPHYNISTDKSYREQLKLAAKRDPKTYGKYVKAIEGEQK